MSERPGQTPDGQDLERELRLELRSHRAERKSLLVDFSNQARKTCQSIGMEQDETDALVDAIRVSDGGMIECRRIFESEAPFATDTKARELCFLVILGAAEKGKEFDELNAGME